jgi:hypothetical protein
MLPTESKNAREDPKRKARQAAIDYGIDVNQLDYVLPLTGYASKVLQKERRVMLILSQSVSRGRKERTDDPKEA